MVKFSRAIFIGIYIIWNIANIIYIDSLSNLRQALLQNIISWLAIILIIASVAFSVAYRKSRIVITLPALCYCLALIILVVSLIFSKKANQELDLWYWSGITGGVLFYIVGLQLKNKWSIQFFCIYGYIAVVGIQAILAFYQYLFESDAFYFAEEMRSNGLSQHINVLSINISTACLLSLTTLILSQFRLSSKRNEQFRIIAISILIFIFTLMIILFQAITSILIFIICIFIFTFLFYKKNKARFIGSYLIIFFALLMSAYLINERIESIDDFLVNQFYLNQILRFSMTLFFEQPYELWSDILLQESNHNKITLPFLNIQYFITPRSHNEIFLWIMTGGYINLIFMSLVLTGGVYIAFQSFIKYKESGNGYSLAIILSITPMIIYSNIKYPFLLSALHWGMIILFLSFSDVAFPLKTQSLFYINRKLSHLFGFVVSFIALAIFIIGLFTLNREQSIYENDLNQEIKLSTNKITQNNNGSSLPINITNSNNAI